MGKRSGEPPEEGRERPHRSGISDARAFSPRGRTTRDTDELRLARERRLREEAAEQADDRRRGSKSRRSEQADEPRGSESRRTESRRSEPHRSEPHRSEPRSFEPRRSERAGLPRAGSRRSAAATPRQRRDGAARGKQRPFVPGPAKRPSASAMPTPPKLGEPRRRIRLAGALSLLLFAVIGVRLVQLQLTDASVYAAKGLTERLETIVLPAPRGSIYDRTGAVLVHSVEAKYVAADPELVVDPPATAAALSPLLGMAPSELLPLLRKKKQEVSGKPVRFQWLARGVDISVAEQVKALNLQGIRVERDERRNMPGRDLAANVIGFTGTDLNGLAGIEARFDDVLRGRNGELIFEVGQGALSKPIPGGYQVETPAHPGSSLTLTIDRDVQHATQRILAEQMVKVRATYGGAVVLDAHTGEVIAMASYPTFDAVDWQKYDPKERIDVATSTVVDPGSVHKAIVLAAALEEGVIEPDSTVVVGPTITKGDQVFRDTRQFPQGTPLTLYGVMAFSSNVGTIKIADKLGAQKLYEYQRKFGLGEATGIGIPGEATGLVQPPDNWSGSSYGSVPIGHSVATTPLQMAAAYAAIANGGVWVQPHLIKNTISANGTVTAAPAAKSHRVISEENAAAMRLIMESVTTADQATGRSAALAGYRVAGKTGTGAQVVDGEYIKGEVASFIGMAPADNPRYVIAVFAHTPGGTGGSVAGPAFRDMMAFTLRHFKVLPSREPAPTFQTQG